ncbi:Sex determination protein fruitless [Armadillidium vulgare]|nr:Sex determination protein fruitless [Armadillidium vulgare]
MSGHLCLKWNNHSAAFISSISNIQTKEKYCDATIACQGKYFPVHRVILSTCSEYFEEMFERIVCPHPYIVFKDIEPGEMELLLNYMYQGEVNVVQEKLPSLIKAAEALKIKGLAVPDDLPSTKEPSGRKRSHQGDESLNSRRRNEEKRKRTSDLSSHSDSCRDSTSLNAVSPVRSEEKEEPKLIKEEPIDNIEYVEANLLTNEFSGSDTVGTDNVLPSASNESGDLNKSESEYPEYNPVGGENSFIKTEDSAPTEESYDNQSSSWTDFGDSEMQNLNLPQTSQQDDVSV